MESIEVTSTIETTEEKTMTNRRNKSRTAKSRQRSERVVYETESNDRHPKRTPPKRLPNNLLKLYEKEILDQEQYAAGERLLIDYESSFRNTCLSTRMEDVRIQKSNKRNSEVHLIQNLCAWDRYSKAIMSIEDLQTREVVKQFCLEGKGLTEIDKGMKKQGVAEVRLWYGLRWLGRYYCGRKK